MSNVMKVKFKWVIIYLEVGKTKNINKIYKDLDLMINDCILDLYCIKKTSFYNLNEVF